jgi:hypothetical protein
MAAAPVSIRCDRSHFRTTEEPLLAERKICFMVNDPRLCDEFLAIRDKLVEGTSRSGPQRIKRRARCLEGGNVKVLHSLAGF